MPFTLKFTDPGLRPRTVEADNWDDVERELEDHQGYTSVVIGFPDATRQDLWRPLSHKLWLPFSARPWFKTNYPDAL